MKRSLLLIGLLCAFFIAACAVPEAQAQCPPGYVFTGPRGCMPARPPGVPPPGVIPPPGMVPPPPFVRPCPPGTIFRAGACRRVAPPLNYGITITPPTIIIRP